MSAFGDAPRLYLDILAAQDPYHYERGIPRYVAMHAAALVERPGTVSRLALNPHLGSPRSLPAEHRLSPLLCWNSAAELDAARREGPVVYHLMSAFHIHPWVERWFPFAALTPDDMLVVTVYDAVPLLEPQEYQADRTLEGLFASRFRLIQHADLVLTPSRNTGHELVALLGLDASRVAWIGGGVAPFFAPAADENEPARVLAEAVPELRRPYVMCVTHHYERKNTELLLDAFGKLSPSLRRDLQLVLVGSLQETWRDRFVETAQQAGLAGEQLVLTGRVPDAVLRALYQRARLLVAPSLSEGWGLPVAEAIACGCPAITSDTSALPEVVDWHPSTFDPRDADDLARVMARALDDREFRTELEAVCTARAQEHRWDKVAERTVAAVARTADRDRRWRRGGRAPARRRLRVAFAGRVDGGGVGEDAYNAELVAAIADHAAVDVYASGDPPPPGSELAGAEGVFPIGALWTMRSPHAYDLIVHSLGTGPESARQLTDAAHAPGVVWLHGSDLVKPEPAPPTPLAQLPPPEHRPHPHPALVAAARVIAVDWEADRRLLQLTRTAGNLPVERLPLGADAVEADAPGEGGVALVVADSPDDTLLVDWLDALLTPEAAALGMQPALVGQAPAVSGFAAREPFVVGRQPVVSLVDATRREQLDHALRSARVVVDATTDSCAAAMSARACMSVGRRLLTRRPALAELGPSHVHVVSVDQDPREVLLDEVHASKAARSEVSVADVVGQLLEIATRHLVRGAA